MTRDLRTGVRWVRLIERIADRRASRKAEAKPRSRPMGTSTAIIGDGESTGGPGQFTGSWLVPADPGQIGGWRYEKIKDEVLSDYTPESEDYNTQLGSPTPVGKGATANLENKTYVELP